MAGSTEPPVPVAKTAELMLATVLLVFVLFLFALFLYLYIKRYNGAIPILGRTGDRPVSTPTEPENSSADPALPPPRGLDPTAIKSLPFVVFKSKEFNNGGIDCPVCLSELTEGEEARILPKCNHGFHLECIDMWLFSHSTCPLCRCPVIDDVAAEQKPADPQSSESAPNFPTNVLFWGSLDQIRIGVAPSSVQRPPGEISVVEVSRQGLMSAALATATAGPAPAPAAEETKLPASARVRSLRRLLTRGSRGLIIGSSCSPRRDDDIEQGFGSAMAESSSSVSKIPSSS